MLFSIINLVITKNTRSNIRRHKTSEFPNIKIVGDIGEDISDMKLESNINIKNRNSLSGHMMISIPYLKNAQYIIEGFNPNIEK